MRDCGNNGLLLMSCQLSESLLTEMGLRGHRKRIMWQSLCPIVAQGT